MLGCAVHKILEKEDSIREQLGAFHGPRFLARYPCNSSTKYTWALGEHNENERQQTISCKSNMYNRRATNSTDD
jgi:hypothetical protein